ncbi:MAG: hypothetical protein KJN89_08655 [Gammaproteobacteria bacterium]|nr:hypothetical protein [Gammaproteobacteria bacterium]MBT8133675.1 hypothetical protein [Gammaproteobacteria bacterium]NNJ50435.1 hypothetical protein [Gammaproteobacteria bacterium]
MIRLSTLITPCLIYSAHSFAADVVPYSVDSIKAIGSGYVELIGPGKIAINDETVSYQGIKYIKADNIDTMSAITGSTKGCVLAYSSEGYTENISVLNQSCDVILQVINNAK